MKNNQDLAVTLYGIPNCDTVKKARAWLEQHQLAYQFHDFKKLGIDTDSLTQWLQQIPIETLINRKGTTWRTLSAETQARATSAQAAITLMQTHTSVIKRPILSITKNAQSPYLIAGFHPEEYQRIFSYE